MTEYKLMINGSTVGNTVTYTIPKGVTNLAAEYHKRDMIISQQAARIKELEAALGFYADIENWKWVAKPTDTDFILDCGSEVQRDFSRRANEALKQRADV